MLGGSDVPVPPRCDALSWHAGVGGLVVQEVEVNPVRVVRDDGGEESGEGLCGFAPGAPGHGSGIVDEEDGVEGGQEGVGVFWARLGGDGGRRGVGGGGAENGARCRGGSGCVSWRRLVGGDGEGVEACADGAAGGRTGVEELGAVGGLEGGGGELDGGDGGDGGGGGGGAGGFALVGGVPGVAGGGGEVALLAAEGGFQGGEHVG